MILLSSTNKLSFDNIISENTSTAHTAFTVQCECDDTMINVRPFLMEWMEWRCTTTMSKLYRNKCFYMIHFHYSYAIWSGAFDRKSTMMGPSAKPSESFNNFFFAARNVRIWRPCHAISATVFGVVVNTVLVRQPIHVLYMCDYCDFVCDWPWPMSFAPSVYNMHRARN